jgi:hypothetical protein
MGYTFSEEYHSYLKRPRVPSARSKDATYIREAEPTYIRGPETDFLAPPGDADDVIVANKRDLANRATLLTKEEFSRMNLGPTSSRPSTLGRQPLDETPIGGATPGGGNQHHRQNSNTTLYKQGNGAVVTGLVGNGEEAALYTSLDRRLGRNVT